MIGRTIPEWIGKSADSTVPARVRLRVYEKTNGRDAHDGTKLRKGWHVDHIIELRDWTGEGHGNRESNLQALNVDRHLEKTAKSNSARAKVNAIRTKHAGISGPKAKIQSAGFHVKPKKASMMPQYIPGTRLKVK